MTTEHGQSVAWSSTPPVEPPAAPGLWATRGYRWLWLVSLLLGAGYGLTMSTQSLLWEEFDFSYTSSTWITLANGLGIVAGYVAAGMFADRRPKRHLFHLTALALAAMSAVIALLELGDLLKGRWFYVVAALLGIGHGAASAVVLGWVGELLPRRLIAKGVVVLSLSSFAHGILLSIPAVFLSGEQHAILALFAIASVLYLSAAVSSRRVPVALAPGKQFESALQGLKSGAAYMWRDPRIQTLWIYFLLAGVLSILLHFALTDLLLTENDADTLTFSLSFTVRGVAAIVATIGLVYVISGRNRWRVYLAASVIAGITVVLLSFVSDRLLLFLLFIPQGAAMSVVVLASQALAISATRMEYFGRVAALLLIAGNVLSFASGFTSGLLTDWFDSSWLTAAIGLILILTAGWLYRRWRGFRHLPEDPDFTQELPDFAAPFAAFLNDGLAPQKIGAVDGSSLSGSDRRYEQDSESGQR